jgi:hypothetical protein
MIVCNDPAFVFYAVPRTASRAIAAHLLTLFAGARQVGGHHMMAVLPGMEDHFKFAVVRNPYWRHLSHYLYRRSRIGNNMHRQCSRWSFKEYLAWDTDLLASPLACHEPPQAVMLARLGLDRVLCFERLQRDFSELPFLDSANRGMPVPKKNGNASYRLADYYDDACMQMVRRFAAIDFETYGYDPERLPDE